MDSRLVRTSDGATYSLQGFHWMRQWLMFTFLQICSNENKLNYILDGKSKISSRLIFIFGWTIPNV